MFKNHCALGLNGGILGRLIGLLALRMDFALAGRALVHAALAFMRFVDALVDGVSRLVRCIMCLVRSSVGSPVIIVSSASDGLILQTIMYWAAQELAVVLQALLPWMSSACSLVEECSNPADSGD